MGKVAAIVALTPEILDSAGSQAEMPPDAAIAFGVYANDGNRSPARTAALLKLNESTLRSWSSRYRWPTRVKETDAQVGRGSLDRAVTYAASLRYQALQSLSESLDAVTYSQVTGAVLGPDWRARNDAAKALLDRAGMRPYSDLTVFDAGSVSIDPELAELPDDASPSTVLDALIRLRQAS